METPQICPLIKATNLKTNPLSRGRYGFSILLFVGTRWIIL